MTSALSIGVNLVINNSQLPVSIYIFEFVTKANLNTTIKPISTYIQTEYTIKTLSALTYRCKKKKKHMIKFFTLKIIAQIVRLAPPLKQLADSGGPLIDENHFDNFRKIVIYSPYGRVLLYEIGIRWRQRKIGKAREQRQRSADLFSVESLYSCSQSN